MKISPIFFCVILSISPAFAKTDKVSVAGAKIEIYKQASGDDLRIYRIDPADHNPQKDKRAAAVFFFGGGWNGGSVRQFEPHAKYLAKRGMVVFLADYRVKSRQNTTPRECVADGKSAIRWVRKNATRLGVDPNKIAAGGGSAGGHVAAATGICSGFDEPDEDAKISSRPNALLLFNPVYDNGPGGFGASRVTEWFPAISPAHNISKDNPPTIVFLGTKDKLIPVATAEKFRDDQKKAGVKSVLHLYKDQPHGFFNMGKSRESFIDTVLKMDQFLIDLGYLKGEPDEAAVKALAGAGKKKN